MIGKFEFIVIVMFTPHLPSDRSTEKPIVRWHSRWLRMLTTSCGKPVILLTSATSARTVRAVPQAQWTDSSNQHAVVLTRQGLTRRRWSDRARSAIDSCQLRLFPLALGSCLLGACAPTLDWRTVVLPDSSLEVQLPCRPARFQRDLVVAGRPLTIFMLSCEADGATYGVATADVGDATRVDAVLAALAGTARSAIRSHDQKLMPFQLPGATPFDQSVSARLQGERPDGSTVEESLRLFARGMRVFQASVIGSRLPESATRPFEDGLRFDLENQKTDPR